jgi:CPA1 family monovalent cation:H+ antiporter
VAGLELVVVLGLVMLACGIAGNRLGVAPPVLLLAAGALLGFIPALRRVHLPPEVVLLLFLPALLYWESLTTSLREVRRNLRGIVMLSTVLVIATAAAVAAVAHALGLGWGPAWVLGAALAPTDATAVGVLAAALPRRDVTVLRAESLINDGTALVVYGLAVGATTGSQHLTWPHITWLFLLAYAGGAAIGAAVAAAGIALRRRLTDPLQGTLAMLLIPFTAYLLAEAIDASGVVAVVICGLIMTRAGPRAAGAATRTQIQTSWRLATYLLNGALFVLIGLQAHTAVRTLTSSGLAAALALGAAAYAVLLGTRLVFLFTAAYLTRMIDRRPQQRLRRNTDRSRIVSALAGFRGAVSLAAALAVPTTLNSGATFPHRDLIIFATCTVIVLTLLQSVPLPAVVRWARLPAGTALDTEQRLAQTLATRQALDALPCIAADLGTDPQVTRQLRQEYRDRLLLIDHTDRDHTDRDPDTRQHAQALAERQRQETDLRLALIAHKRATVLQLRDQQRIDDTVLRRLQDLLDIEEVRLTTHTDVE